jgi:hypothetical protein
VQYIVKFVIPKLHILGHLRWCQEFFSLLFTLGAAQADMEGIKRIWSSSGLMGASTREMEPVRACKHPPFIAGLFFLGHISAISDVSDVSDKCNQIYNIISSADIWSETPSGVCMPGIRGYGRR